MMKKTHIATALVLTIPVIVSNPISVLGVTGAVAADWDIYLGIKHRTWTHSLLSLIGSSLILLALNRIIAIVWFISYTSHLLLDGLTVSGVPLLYPKSKKRYGLRKLKTRGAEDCFILIIAIGIICTVYL